MVLNIGWARAASTAFRANFLRAMPGVRLLGRDGSGPGAPTVAMLKAGSDADFTSLEEPLSGLWRSLVEGAPEPVVCLSDEELSIGLPGEASPTEIGARCARLFDDATVLAVIRDQVDAIRSFYGLTLSLGRAEGLGLSAWTARHFLNSQRYAYLYDYRSTLTAYQASRLVVLDYGELVTAPQAAYRRAARGLGLVEPAAGALPEARLNASPQGADRALDPAVEHEIRALYAPVNAWLAAEFRVRFPMETAR